MIFLINQIALAFFNLVNSKIDAYRILKNKSIAHGINFAAYAAFTALVVWIADYDLYKAIVFSISGFFNRQLSFDIPLNIRRGLPWDYQSTANPPKAIMDRIERVIFKRWDGAEIVIMYTAMWVITIVMNLK